MKENQATNKNENKIMKYIMKRRKVVSRLKSQEEELESLRVELNRLRQRTFPSFLSLTFRKGKNPDERD